MAHDPHHHVDRYIPARTNEGWGVVGLVVLLTAACIAGATYFYQTTYKHPTDVHMQAAGQHQAAEVAGH